MEYPHYLLDRKITIHTFHNYIKAKDHHIFIGFKKENSEVVKQLFGIRSRIRVHIFIGSVNNDFNSLARDLYILMNRKCHNDRIIIHIPKQAEDVIIAIKDAFDKLRPIDLATYQLPGRPKVQFYVDHKPILFRVNDNWPPNYLKVYFDDKENVIRACLTFEYIAKLDYNRNN